MLAILITLDCAREDHVTGPRARTACLDAFREDAVTFKGAHAHSNTTLPSHVTMMTGQLMPEHGVTFNQCEPSRKNFLLTEQLAQRGVRCAGFVSIQFMETLYASKIDGVDPFYTQPSNAVLAKTLRLMGLKGTRRGAAQTTREAMRWIRADAEGDAFCWVHLFDSHMAYVADARWRRHYGVPEARTAKTLERTLEAERLVCYHPLARERHSLEYYPRMYQAATSWTDEVMGRLFSDLKAMGRYDEALIVVTGDHGENLLEHGVYCSHPLLFDETIRVPLVVKFPGNEHSGEEVSAAVGHQDIMPTIMRHFGVGNDRPQGHDLAEYLGGSPAEDERPLLAFHNKMLQGSVRRGSWLYIENLNLDRVLPNHRGLYDATGLFDRSGTKVEHPAVEAELGLLLRTYLHEAEKAYLPPRVEEDDIAAQLRGLGYL